MRAIMNGDSRATTAAFLVSGGLKAAGISTAVDDETCCSITVGWPKALVLKAGSRSAALDMANRQ